MLLHTQPLIRVRHTCAGWGQRCCGGSSAGVLSEFAVLSLREEAALNSFLFPLPLIPGMLKLDWWTFQNFVFQTLSAIITSRCTLVLLFLINPSAVTLSCLLSRAVLLSSYPVLLFWMCLCSFFSYFCSQNFPPSPPTPCFFPADTFPVRCCLKPVGRCVGTGQVQTSAAVASHLVFIRSEHGWLISPTFLKRV